MPRTAFHEPGHRLPSPDDYDALVVMGGPMGVHDEPLYPWLSAEKAHIRSAIDAGKPVLGICLGAQLIAHTLGAGVAPHRHKEIGWFDITFTDAAATHPMFAGMASTMRVLHWHGDRFEIPGGAWRIAGSAACDNQGFLYRDRVLGLQFHLEMDRAAIMSIMDNCGHELTESPFIQSRQEILEQETATDTASALYRLLDNWESTFRT
ncbi:MAG: type 1 glutamine amidotransferase [Alphaproteobacteria bacterium]|nr:type 1 glutamine amidotransferase [Alphaproteobacteria bacterium]